MKPSLASEFPTQKGSSPHRTFLRDQVFDNLSVNIGEAKIPALEAIGQSLVIETEQMHDGRLEIMNMYFIFGYRKAHSHPVRPEPKLNTHSSPSLPLRMYPASTRQNLFVPLFGLPHPDRDKESSFQTISAEYRG
tara:strand:+ start:47 stop:451 length:405 start_codon:yes stop_codon:yes gene_type:complete